MSLNYWVTWLLLTQLLTHRTFFGFQVHKCIVWPKSNQVIALTIDELEGLYNLRHFHVLTTAASSYINNGSLDIVHACL